MFLKNIKQPKLLTEEARICLLQLDLLWLMIDLLNDETRIYILV